MNGMPSSRSSRILLVQYDPDICRALSDSLEREGYGVDAVSYGRDALNRLKTTGYVTVLLDVKLPDVDGVSLLRAVKDMNRSIPVIVLSGFRTAEIVNAALNEGACEYMTMPYETSELKSVLRRATGTGGA